jgi:hypothetical protein
MIKLGADTAKTPTGQHRGLALEEDEPNATFSFRRGST